MPFLRRRQEDETGHRPLFPLPRNPSRPSTESRRRWARRCPRPGLEMPPAPVESQFQPVEGAEEMLDMPLGTLIFRAGLIAPQQLEDALAEGLRTGKRLGEVLLARGWLSEEDLSRLLAGQKGLPYADLDRVAIDPELARTMSYEDARQEMALPLVTEFGVPVVAMCDPERGCMERLQGAARRRVAFRGRRAERAQPPDRRGARRRGHGTLAPASRAHSRARTGPPEPPVEQPLPVSEQVPVEPAPAEAPPAEAPPVFAEEYVDSPIQEQTHEGVNPIVGEGEIDYPSFESYEEIPAPEPLGGAVEQLPAEAQLGEFGYYGDASLLEGNAWQAGEPGPNGYEPAPEAELPAEYAAYEQAPPEDGAQPVGADSWQEPAQEALEPAEEPVVEWVQEPAEPIQEPAAGQEPLYEAAPEEIPAEQGEEEPPMLTTPAWMRGEVNVITADVADFIEPSTPEAPVPAEEPEPQAPTAELASPAATADQEDYEPALEPPLEYTEQAPDDSREPPPAAGEPRSEFELIVRLSDGNQVPVGMFGTLEEAQEQAGAVVKQFSEAKDGSWPFIGGRYLRPETIVSIDIEHHESGWSGSGNRGRMFSGGD